MVKIKKVYDKHYTVINNSVLNDVSLKCEDKGLFAYLWSQADEWDFYAKEVAKHSADSEEKIYKILRKLEEHGYLLRERQRNSKGQLKANKWYLSETPKQKWINIFKKRSTNKKPIRQNPKQVKPDLEKPNMEKPDLTSTNCNKYLSKQVKNLNKSLSKEERERDANVIEILLNYLNHCAEEWHHVPIMFSQSEVNKLIKAVHGKDTRGLKEAAEKTIVYGEQYPQGYLLSCIKNLPEEVANEE